MAKFLFHANIGPVSNDIANNKLNQLQVLTGVDIAKSTTRICYDGQVKEVNTFAFYGSLRLYQSKSLNPLVYSSDNWTSFAHQKNALYVLMQPYSPTGIADSQDPNTRPSTALTKQTKYPIELNKYKQELTTKCTLLLKEEASDYSSVFPYIIEKKQSFTGTETKVYRKKSYATEDLILLSQAEVSSLIHNTKEGKYPLLYALAQDHTRRPISNIFQSDCKELLVYIMPLEWDLSQNLDNPADILIPKFNQNKFDELHPNQEAMFIDDQELSFVTEVLFNLTSTFEMMHQTKNSITSLEKYLDTKKADKYDQFLNYSEKVLADVSYLEKQHLSENNENKRKIHLAQQPQDALKNANSDVVYPNQQQVALFPENVMHDFES